VADGYNASQQAEGKIYLATERLMGRYPFHASILERCKVRPMPEVGTMGITVSAGEIVLLHNPAFILELRIDELGGVLLHEVHHVVLGHVLASPEDFPDQWARTVAEEVTANEFIHEPLPQGAMTLDRFPGLPPMESTAQRYNRLRKPQRRPALGTLQVAQEPATCCASPSKASQQPQQDNDTSTNSSQENKCSTRHNGKDAGAVEHIQEMPDGRLETLDDHTVWTEAFQHSDQSRDVIRDLVQEATFQVGLEEIPPELYPVLSSMGVGRQEGQSCLELERVKGGRQNWRWLLRQHIGQVLEPRPDFTRPPRRFPHLIGVFPAQLRQAAKPIILAVVDTSESITSRLLEQINGELARLARSFRVKVVECDAKIQRVYEYRPLKHVHGRGGTDLRPPLKRKFLRRHRPDLVVYFTDGEGPAPVRRPGTPVIWCLTPEGKRPATWGHCLRMDACEPTVHRLAQKSCEDRQYIV
jgi:predicted metal-dependent peptidase